MARYDHFTTHTSVKSCPEALSSLDRPRPWRPLQRRLTWPRALPAPPHHPNVLCMVHISHRWTPPRYCVFLQSVKHASSKGHFTLRILPRAPSRQEHLASFSASQSPRLRTSRCRSRRPSGQWRLHFKRPAALKSSLRQWARLGMCPPSKTFSINTVKASALANPRHAQSLLAMI